MFPIVFDAQIRTGLLSFGVFILRFIKNAEGFLKTFVLQKKKKNVCKGDVLLKHSVQDFG